MPKRTKAATGMCMPAEEEAFTGEDMIKMTYKCFKPAAPAPKELTAAEKAAALVKKWSGKDCTKETVAANKTECTTAQAGAKVLAATFMTVASVAALM